MKNRIIVFLQNAGILKPRSIKKLLKLMLEHQELFQCGLCMWVRKIHGKEIISHKEFFILKNYIYNSAPSDVGAYWFKPYVIEPRIKWIEEQILKNK